MVGQSIEMVKAANSGSTYMIKMAKLVIAPAAL